MHQRIDKKPESTLDPSMSIIFRDAIFLGSQINVFMYVSIYFTIIKNV